MTLSDWINLALCILSFLLAVISVITVIITIKQNQEILKATRNELQESIKQNSLSTGLSLLPMRKEVLKGFSKKRYDDIFWDATILFSPHISAEILTISHLEERYNSLIQDINEYEQRMSQDAPAAFEEYQRLLALLSQHPDDECIENQFVTLCNQYHPVIEFPGEEPKILDYTNISQESKNLKSKADALHMQLFMKMRKEIEESIM